jgi:O-antigen/teichoic acid export membrane protein
VGVISGGVVWAVLANFAVRLPPKLPKSISSIRPQIDFGGNVVVARVSWYAYTNIDFAIVGRLMSESVVGLYSMAWNIASVPAEKLAGLVVRVAPSVLSAAREKPGEMRRYYLLLVRGVALVTFPIAVGLCLVSDAIVRGLLGENWAGSIDALRLLALFFAVRSVASLAPVVMIAQGKPRVDRNYSIVYLLLLPPCFLVSARWGITGVAATWLIAYPLLYGLFGHRWVLKTLGVSVLEFLQELWPAALSVALMCVPVIAIGRWLDTAPALERLVVMSAAGTATYVLALRTIHPASFEAALNMVRRRGVSG